MECVLWIGFEDLSEQLLLQLSVWVVLYLDKIGEHVIDILRVIFKALQVIKIYGTICAEL